MPDINKQWTDELEAGLYFFFFFHDNYKSPLKYK